MLKETDQRSGSSAESWGYAVWPKPWFFPRKYNRKDWVQCTVLFSHQQNERVWYRCITSNQNADPARSGERNGLNGKLWTDRRRRRRGGSFLTYIWIDAQKSVHGLYLLKEVDAYDCAYVLSQEDRDQRISWKGWDQCSDSAVLPDGEKFSLR